MTTSAADKIRRRNLGLPYPFRDPTGELEARICEAFAYALDVDQVGADDEFFDLGGDSLKAEAVAMAIASMTSHEIRVSWLASHGAPAKLAAMLSGPVGRSPRADTPPPVFAVHGRLGFILPRPEITDRLAPGQELRMFELPGLRGQGETPKWVEDIAAGYVNELNAVYPEGPVSLLGFCAGSLVALEMATQLQAQGRGLEQFVLGDPHLPDGTIKNMGRTPARAGWSPEASFTSRLRWKLRQVVFAIALGRRTDGAQDQDFADERLRALRERFYGLYMSLWKLEVALRRRKTKLRHVNMSTRAQARLLAAYRHYKPSIYQGPVTVLVSTGRRRLVPALHHILPNADIEIVDAGHSETVSMAAGLFGERAGMARAAAGTPAQGDSSSIFSRSTEFPGLRTANAHNAMGPAE